MSRFNVTTKARTFEGGTAYRRDPRTELFLLAVSNMVGENTFYEAGDDRDERFRALIHKLAVSDAEWLARLIGWLRTGALMRTASVVAAAEMVKARLDAGLSGGNRQVIDSALQRADEPGELLAYWIGRYGRAIPKPVKRGVGDAVRRLYDERSLAKYDAQGRAVRFGDVLELTHPAPATPAQGDLFKHAIDRRHGRADDVDGVPGSLTTLVNRARLLAVPVAERRAVLDLPDAAETLRAAGMTWEALAGWLQGPLDARVWEAVAPSMGYLARLRNLRNFDRAGMSDDAAGRIAEGLAAPEAVARSRALPMRFLAAFQAAPSLRWAWALERALDGSLGCVPRLGGRTLILVDRSGSMFCAMSARSQLTRADTGAVFGAALALRCANADLVQFGTTSARVRFSKGDSVLKIVERFRNLGGTDTAQAVRAHYRDHDRVVIVTDEQVWGGYHGGKPTKAVPADIPVYTWNLAGYEFAHGPDGPNRHTFGGLSDAAFAMIPLIEAGRIGDWPF